MSDKQDFQPQNDDGELPKADPQYSAERRRFLLKGTIVSAPILMTVASRPVWGLNCGVSGQLSGNLSHPEGDCGGEGCNSNFWVQNTHHWHMWYPSDMKFYDAFNEDAFPGLSLLQVISLQDSSQRRHMFDIASPYPGCNPIKSNGDPDGQYYEALRQLAFQSVAALQNSATGLSYDLTVADVIASFSDAYRSCDISRMEAVVDRLDFLNNQNCPII